MWRMKKKWKLLLGIVLACVSFLTALTYSSCYLSPKTTGDSFSSRLPGLKNTRNASFDRMLELKGTKKKIAMLAKVIYKAKKHVRGSKTSDYLSAAISIMDNILGDTEIQQETLYNRRSESSTNICPETFMGGNFGFPLYYKGFVTKPCGNSVPIHNLITVIKYIDFYKNNVFEEIIQFITSVNDTYKNVSVLLAMNSEAFSGRLKMEYPWVNTVDSRKLTEGSALNSLIEQVTTPYVLVARNANVLTNDSRLERLIGEIERLDIVAAGGPFRELNGHWSRGCFQTTYRNFSLKYTEGYDVSLHECLFCDYIEGPFVTTTNYLKQNKFMSLTDSGGLYEDWFFGVFQKGQETVVCPDAMFSVRITPRSNSNWEGFLQKWNLYTIITPTGHTFRLECEGKKISEGASRALSPCDLQLNTEAVKLIMRTCEETDVICELQEGTALGVVKMGKALHWDVGFDIRFLGTNCSQCKKLEHALHEAGFSFDKFASFCCTRKFTFGERINVGMRYKGYYGDLTGHAVMDSELLTKEGVVPTKILLDGLWVNVPRNPALFVRNRYGKEIYHHAEHWSYTGGKNKHYRMNYTTNVFLPCKYPGRRECLDRYNGDGNLQFIDLLP